MQRDELLLGERAHIGIARPGELLRLLDLAEDVLMLPEPLDERLDLGERPGVLAVFGRVALHAGIGQQARQLRAPMFDRCRLSSIAVRDRAWVPASAGSITSA